jgi:hypothetical protein
MLPRERDDRVSIEGNLDAIEVRRRQRLCQVHVVDLRPYDAGRWLNAHGKSSTARFPEFVATLVLSRISRRAA